MHDSNNYTETHNGGNSTENLLKPCPIHAHHKFKNFFTSRLHNTYCLHSSTAAPWLHKEAYENNIHECSIPFN